jgi:hypothetical protein
MKTKSLTLLTTIIIALLTISYSYACTNTNSHTNQQSEQYLTANIGFINAQTSDNENTQDTAKITAQITYDRKTINVVIINAYPNYEAQVTYTIKNTGNKPIQFTSLTISNSNPEALQIITTNHQGTILQPSQTTQGTTTIHILPIAQHRRQYTFQIENTAELKKTCHPQRANFWTEQFQAALGRGGQLSIDTATLEQYLNQIIGQSQAFTFRGTRNQKFQQALNILDTPYRNSAEMRLRMQLLALWLNQAAEYTEGFESNGKTAQQIIQSSESTLQNRQTSRCDYWQILCEQFNNLT